MTERIHPQSESAEMSLALRNEIDAMLDTGYEVSVGESYDEAYERPDKIAHIFNLLHVKGREFTQVAGKLRLGRIALFDRPELRVLPAISSVLRPFKQRDHQTLEFMRADILFDETKMPWHLQRGKALALQTISDAHRLITVDGQYAGQGEHETMSGRLMINTKSFRFDEADGSIAGLDLKQALIQSNMRFRDLSEIKATKQTDRALAELDMFLAAPVTQEFKDIVAYSTDSLGIRSRKQEVRAAISNHVHDVHERDPARDSMTLLSVGCGTAESILEIASDIMSRGIRPHVILIDQDPIALAAAKTLSIQYGLSKDMVELHCERLFDKRGQPFDMKALLRGRKVDIAEDTGLREYLPDTIYANLSSVIWDNLAEDGMISTGNMNKNRPQPEFLHGLMGWRPSVQMRHLADGFRLHELSGIPKGKTIARITRDGVYSLFFSYK